MSITKPKESEFTVINEMKKTLRFDLPASFVVFLVALPLCLGIALASGAPLISGLIAGIIGGVLVGFLSGSEVSVSGPAAGLAVIVASSIQKLGSFDAFLTALVLAGFFQLLLGKIRAGVIGNYFPTSVIEGMLAAIGIVIVLKQIPHAVGWDNQFEGEMSFISGEENTFSSILIALKFFTPIAFLISLLSLFILIYWEKILSKKFRMLTYLPPSLIVVFLGITINEISKIFFPAFQLSVEKNQLVSIPDLMPIGNVLEKLHFPDFHALFNKETYIISLTIGIVASLESLLSLEAADKLDPYKRISDTNRELRAQGIGNIVSGLLGGLPITAVIVRTSANIYAGAKSRYSSIFHGLLLLISILTIPFVLNKIPLASLAAILIVVGYRLGKVKLFVGMFRAGNSVFIPFIVTVLAVVFTDLLIGIAIGSVVGFFFVIRANHHSSVTMVSQDDYYLIRFNKDMSFVNKAELKECLIQIPDKSLVCIDGTKAIFIDNDIYDVINDFQESAKYKEITIETRNIHSKELPLFNIRNPRISDKNISKQTAENGKL
ncbi:MAG: SulP family inorganic anion transporter [Chloroherpetonaceae bacterium]|nr:SulP family inorganic anion transporter [Chloroherpetonaceae bacterium]